MRNSCRADSPPLRILALALLVVSAPGAAAAAAITGVCPDGSVYVVQSEAQIPCSHSKRVEPHEVPPLRPEFLPSPYTWRVWSESQDPNNPYNLIDAARKIRESSSSGSSDGGAPPAVSDVPTGGAPSQASRPSVESGPLDLGLSDEELRDLFRIVQLAQERTPAQFARDTADGRGVLRVALAHSAAFEARLHQAWASRGGLGTSRVLLFTALTKRAESFHANFSFVQGHLSYQPDVRNPQQVGILQGHLGGLDADEVVLGYVVLPAAMDLSSDLDIYWNDRRTSARFEG